MPPPPALTPPCGVRALRPWAVNCPSRTSKRSVGEQPTDGVISRLTATGAGSVLAVENSQIAPRPVSGNQNQPSTAPTRTESVSKNRPSFRTKVFRRTEAASGSAVDRIAVRVNLTFSSASRIEDAICLVSVDDDVPEDVLGMVRSLELVMQATPLAF